MIEMQYLCDVYLSNHSDLCCELCNVLVWHHPPNIVALSVLSGLFPFQGPRPLSKCSAPENALITSTLIYIKAKVWRQRLSHTDETFPQLTASRSVTLISMSCAGAAGKAISSCIMASNIDSVMLLEGGIFFVSKEKTHFENMCA